MKLLKIIFLLILIAVLFSITYLQCKGDEIRLDDAEILSSNVKYEEIHSDSLNKTIKQEKPYVQIRAVDLTPPWLSYDTRSINVNGEYAYITNHNSDTQKISIDPCIAPCLSKIETTPKAARSVYVSGNYAYVADWDDGLFIIDINPPESACIVKAVKTPGIAVDVHVVDGFAYVADYDAGLVIIDIDPPESAEIINMVDPPLPYTINYSSKRLNGYIHRNRYGYRSVSRVDTIRYTLDDFENDDNYVEITEKARGVFAQDGYAYLVNRWGLHIFDTTTPKSAHLVNSVLQESLLRNIYVVDDFAYVIGSDLKIIDINPPESAHVAGSVSLPGIADGIYVSDGYAYVTDRSMGLSKIDITSPESAEIAKSYETRRNIRSVFVDDNFAYISSSSRIRHLVGLNIIDIHRSDYMPMLTTSLESIIEIRGLATDIHVSDGYAYITSDGGGLRIIKLWD